jgi:hypothetical protein
MITKKEYKLLEKHVLLDMGYQEQGTFNILENNGNYKYDEKEAVKVSKIMIKLAESINN